MRSTLSNAITQLMQDRQIDSSTAVGQAKVPQFHRDIFPANVVLSANDLCELSRLVGKVNDSALSLEIAAIEQSIDDKGEREQNIKNLMKVEYILRATNGDTIQGWGVPILDDFFERLSSFFISNSSYANRVVNSDPLNSVNAFLSFSAPSLKMDLITLPSNPTENRSVINVVGRDENWVRATAEKLEEFFENRKTLRPVIHGSGAYDLFLYCIYLPVFIGFLSRLDKHFFSWTAAKTILFNIVFAIYVFFIAILIARLLFQTIRWLFPPIEYYKSSRTPAIAARLIIGSIIGSLLLAALYDFIKYLFL